MLYIDTSTNKNNHCGFYFGLEEYLIKDYDYKSDIFLLWSVDPTVMIGRHQVTNMEIDKDFVKENNIHIVRRNSGGGAVYTDPNCLQFSFITSNKSHSDIFRGQVNHIVKAIRKLGKEDFVWKIIYNNIPENKLGEIEIKEIKKHNSYKNGLNSTTGGKSKFRHSDETRKKILVSVYIKHH